MDTSEKDMSKVAYGDGPKEKNNKRRMPNGEKQFGKDVKTMPQESKQVATKGFVKKALDKHNAKYHHGEKPYHRHKENR